MQTTYLIKGTSKTIMSALSRSRDKIVPMEIINDSVESNWKKDTWVRGAQKINIFSHNSTQSPT